MNQWVHVAGSYDGQKMRLYRDGKKVAETQFGLPIQVSNSGPWYIGSGAGDRWNGKIDDVAIYGRVLSDGEVAAHRNRGDTHGDACDPCPGNPDPTCKPTTCQDADGDGYGVKGASNCPGGADRFDCDDADPLVHPGAGEIPGDRVDNNCDGVVDQTFGIATRYDYDSNGNQVRKVDQSGRPTTPTTPATAW